MQPQTTAINTDNSTEIFTSMKVTTTNTQKRVMQVTQNQIWHFIYFIQ